MARRAQKSQPCNFRNLFVIDIRCLFRARRLYALLLLLPEVEVKCEEVEKVKGNAFPFDIPIVQNNLRLEDGILK